jgi:FixJ family two-component response regulator
MSLYYAIVNSPAKLLEAIRELHQGGSPMSGQIAREVIRVFQEKPAAASAEQLTSTERRVLELLARGLVYKEVATNLASRAKAQTPSSFDLRINPKKNMTRKIKAPKIASRLLEIDSLTLTGCASGPGSQRPLSRLKEAL